jgi:oligoribonuclease
MSNYTGGNLVWLDLEMTGLDPKKDKIVEIATIITDANLNVLAEGPDLVIHQSARVTDNMNDWCKEHFTESGLLESIKKSKISLKQAEEKTLEFVKKHCTEKAALLSGNSVHIDREFLHYQMPTFFDYLHYRIIDVSTLKELALRWFPRIDKYPKVEPHRAAGDILESINELKYYQAKIFKNTLP